MTPVDKIINSINFLKQTPEYQDLIPHIIGEIPLSIKRLTVKAYAVFDPPQIVVDRSRLDIDYQNLYPLFIASVFCEMWNLARAKQVRSFIDQAKQGRSTPNDFVEAIEKTEYESVKKTAKFVLTYFPQIQQVISEFQVYDFKQHRTIQEITGHSMTIWNCAKHFFPKQAEYKTLLNPPIETAEERLLAIALMNVVLCCTNQDPSISAEMCTELAKKKEEFEIESKNGNLLSTKLLAWLSLFQSTQLLA